MRSWEESEVVQIWGTEESPSNVSVAHDLAVSTEVLTAGKVSLFGNVSLSNGEAFYVVYSINDKIVGSSNKDTSVVVAAQFLSSSFNMGENNLSWEIFTGTPEQSVFKASKLIFKEFYDYIYIIDGYPEVVKSLDFHLKKNQSLYLGLLQDNPSFVISEMYLKLKCSISPSGDNKLKIYPVVGKWEPALGKIPDVNKDLVLETSVVQGENTINLVPLLISGEPIYGLEIVSDDAYFDFAFEHCEQDYYVVYLKRPRIVYESYATISWENVTLKYKESFKKFVLLRDGTQIFETTDFSVRSYTDTTLSLSSTYTYQLMIYVNVPEEKVWDFNQAMADLWKQPTDKNIEFYEDHIGIRSLPINVYADLVSSFPQNPIQTGEGIFVSTSSGENIYKEFFVSGELDFSDRVTITQLLSQNSMDTNYVSVVERADFVRNLGDGKLYKFKMRKRTRELIYNEVDATSSGDSGGETTE